MSDTCEATDSEELCQMYAQVLIAAKVADPTGLLRWYLPPKPEENWVDIREWFINQFCEEKYRGNNFRGNYAYANFFTNYSVALKALCDKNGIAV